jgi:hypothetical protein
MSSPVVKMPGPEHHFLVPAVLLASCHNQKLSPVEEKADSIRQARKRAEDVKGGFCGLHGTCGSAIGTGIFVSVITRSTPLSETEWRLSNLMTATSLCKISEYEGPRCCKHDSFLAIICAVEFLDKEFAVKISTDHQPVCAFDELNKECHKGNCIFFHR